MAGVLISMVIERLAGELERWLLADGGKPVGLCVERRDVRVEHGG